MVPCSKIAELAREFDGEVRIHKGDQVVDAKAIFDLITLRAEQGTALILEADGESPNIVIDRLVELFNNDFYLDR